jgi:hypothetical protein
MFQSAPLLRGAMKILIEEIRAEIVSIRAPLARGDGGSLESFSHKGKKRMIREPAKKSGHRTKVFQLNDVKERNP